MPDAKLEAVRRLMRSALEEAEGMDLAEGKARRLEWEKEKSELNNIILALEAQLRQANLKRESDQEPNRRQVANLEAWSQELAIAQGVWEKERAARESALQEERIALEQEKIALDIQLRALQERHQKEQEELRRKVAALEASVLQARGVGEAERVELQALLEKAAQEIQAYRETQPEWKKEKARLTARLRGLESQLQGAGQEEWAKEKEELQVRIEALETELKEARTLARPAEASPPLVEEPLPPLEELGPMPTLEAQLEPSWSKIIRLLQRSVANCYGHFRRLAASRLQQGQQAILKLAAADLAQAQDNLKVVGQFLEESGPAPTEGRLEALATTALASWDNAFRLRSLAIVRKFDAKVAPVSFHAETLRVALYQVIRNAYEAMPRGGCLTASLGQDAASGQTRLSFSDTGPGFSPQALSQIFVPFSTSKPGHLGLGLALAQRTMQTLGGEIEAGNGPSGGAVVTLRFPAPSAAPPLSES